MPSPEAQALTAAHQRSVLQVAGLVLDRIRRAVRGADLDDIDSWWDGVSVQMQREIAVGQSATARLARAYLRRHAALEGVTLDPVRVALPGQQITTSLRVTGPVAFKRHVAATGSPEGAVRAMSTQLQGAAERLVLEGSRATTMRTFAERDEIAGWRRTGSSPCAFCALLISRGAVYSKGTVDFQAHDHDRCTPEPLYRREPEPEEVRELYETYKDVTAGTSGRESVEAWRAYWTSRNTGT
ncbi:hypothetical protein ACGRHY_14505 [Streptomyces sp. HK10]|uniref:VG15 protein n=1 Tax=Streptomyces sp. HK10 TaxID=3373255 RepID=UPI003749A838